jgi:transposase-like protein
MIACAHPEKQKHGKDEHGNQRYKCKVCGKRFSEPKDKPLGAMQIPVDDAKLALRMLVEGSSLRSAARITGLDRNTVGKLVVMFGNACREFLDKRMRGLTLTHLQFDEQWTYVAKKQSRLTIDERAECSDIGDVYFGPASTRTPSSCRRSCSASARLTTREDL